jgi:hypothetical protein
MVVKGKFVMNTIQAIIPANGGFLKLAAIGCATMKVAVSDAEQVIEIWSRYRDGNGIGASDMKRGCGDLVDVKGKKVGRVSYNGRIWDVAGNCIYQKEN